VLADLPSSASSSKLSAPLREIEKCRPLCWVPTLESLLWPTPAYNTSVIRRLIIGEEGWRRRESENGALGLETIF